MTAAPEKTDTKELNPSNLRSFSFGLMLAAWWVLTIVIPGWNISRFIEQPGIQRYFAPITIWAYGLTQHWMNYHWLAILLAVIAIPLHYWLWCRRSRYDTYGKWLFKTGFLVLYILLYTFFLIIFVAAELPIYTMPPEVIF